MKKIIFFFHKNHFLILFPCILLMIEYLIKKYTINKELKKKNKKERDFFINISHYLAESLILITIKFFFSEKKIKIKIENKKYKNSLIVYENKKNISYKFLIFFIFIISSIEIFSHIFENNSEIKPITNKENKKSFNYIEIKLCLICIFYVLFFKLNFYNFQYLSISTFIITSVFKLFFNIFEKKNNKEKVLIDFLYHLIRDSLYVLRILLIKYINYFFYINIFLIIGFEGLFNLFFYIIFYIFSFYIFNDENLFQLLNMKLLFCYLIIIIIYFIFYIVFCLIILKFDPIIYCLSILLYDLLKFIYDDLININDYNIFKYKIKITKICFLIIHSIALLVFCQIIQFNFLNLNKNTNINIEIREDKEASQIEIN